MKFDTIKVTVGNRIFIQGTKNDRKYLGIISHPTFQRHSRLIVFNKCVKLGLCHIISMIKSLQISSTARFDTKTYLECFFCKKHIMGLVDFSIF